MNINLGEKLNILANILSAPLYAVGGVVRNFLIDGSISEDVDLSGAITAEEFTSALNKVGLEITATYPRTGTVMFKDGKTRYEFTSFRTETYVSGEHKPINTEFTDSIELDARRRDFKCNAIYYDIKNQRIVDVLKGVSDVKEKRLDTVREAQTVFQHDGLRLMRLARFAGELNFTPTEQVLLAAERFSSNVLDITAERIYSELKMILVADTKYPFSDKNGHYTALKILDRTRVLDKIFPELTLGRDMAQRADFHKFDVLEHSLKTVLYAQKNIRLAALLHDVGKPYCMIKNGEYYNHDLEGEKIAKEILFRLKVDKKTAEKVLFLIKNHMWDMDCKTGRLKVRKFLVKNYPLIPELLSLKQADFTASMESGDVCPTVKKWQGILGEMKTDGTPFSIKELKISANDLIEIGVENKRIGAVLSQLFERAVENPKLNDRAKLVEILKNRRKKGRI